MDASDKQRASALVKAVLKDTGWNRLDRWETEDEVSLAEHRYNLARYAADLEKNQLPEGCTAVCRVCRAPAQWATVNPCQISDKARCPLRPQEAVKP